LIRQAQHPLAPARVADPVATRSVHLTDPNHRIRFESRELCFKRAVLPLRTRINARPSAEKDAMSLLILIIILVLLFGGGGGYYGYRSGYYGGGGHGLIWLVVVVVILFLLFGHGRFGPI
jgi:hypothetical protein